MGREKKDEIGEWNKRKRKQILMFLNWIRDVKSRKCHAYVKINNRKEFPPTIFRNVECYTDRKTNKQTNNKPAQLSCSALGVC